MTKTIPHIAISGSYGGMNLGDEAILWSIVKQWRENGPIDITVYSRNPEDTLKRHKVDRAICIRNMTREEARNEVEKADLLILGGGGILFDGEAENFLREVFLAKEANIPVAIYAISAGPLKKPSIRKMVKDALNKVDLITVRDRQGKQLLEEVGVEKEIFVTADPALLLESEPLSEDCLQKEGLDAKKRMIGISVREPGPAAPDIDMNHYHSLLANTADYMVERLDANVVFVPMERKVMDMQQSHAVMAEMKCVQKATVLKGEYTSGEVASLISHFEFSVGMRLHFLIFSAIQAVPFIALPYASKVAGFVEDLQMQMPRLGEISAGQLIARVDEAWDKRNEIKNRIDKRLPELKQRARATHKKVLELLNQSLPKKVEKTLNL